MTRKRPFENSYWVVPGKFLAGEFPGNSDETFTRRRLTTLLEAGVDTFIDLTEAGEQPSYDQLLHLLSAISENLTHYRRQEIRDFDVPDPQQMKMILDAIDDAMGQDHVVYLHCRGGIGRTGTVVGCWLARHGEPGEIALERLANLRNTIEPYFRADSPETEAQRSMVRLWSG